MLHIVKHVKYFVLEIQAYFTNSVLSVPTDQGAQQFDLAKMIIKNNWHLYCYVMESNLFSEAIWHVDIVLD